MERFELQPVLGSVLAEVAEFLSRSLATETVHSNERRLRWLLIDSPAAPPDGKLGHCVRDESGAIRGLSLQFPVSYLSGDRRLTGLCAGSYFVDPAARSMGFYLFKKYLKTPGYDFYFASTCNAGSGELWKTMGGCPVPNSETEYIVPLRLDAVLPAFVAARTSSQVAAAIARVCGLGANPIVRLLTRPSTKLIVEPCQDWEKLSQLFLRHRSQQHITTDRTAAHLAWRYGPGSPSYPCGIYLFRDELGNEGWFALGDLTHGQAGQLRESVLLDAIWPREQMDFTCIFQEIVRLAADSADAISFRWQPGLDYGEYSRCTIPHRLPAARAFVSVPKGAPRLPLETFDYDDSDYIAWRFQWAN
jgi:hypothetical protein